MSGKVVSGTVVSGTVESEGSAAAIIGGSAAPVTRKRTRETVTGSA